MPKVIVLIFRWHWRQKAIDVSPLTDVTPGRVKVVEHSAQVGINELQGNSLDVLVWTRSVNCYLGSISMMVQPARSKWPARMELACIGSAL
jgi:hypothetical protein